MRKINTTINFIIMLAITGALIFMKKLIVAIQIILILLFSVSFNEPTFGSTKKTSNVLVIYSHHYNFEWVEELQRGISEVLETEDLYFYNEYLNEHQLSEYMSFENLFNAMQEKYKNIEFDCIIVADNYAYNFMAEYYEKLTPDTPLVFVGVNGYSEDMAFTDMMTGIPQNPDIKRLIELILSINSKDELIFISSQNATSIAEINNINRIIKKDFPKLNYRIVVGKTLDDAIDELYGIKDAQLIMIGNIITKEGITLTPRELLSKLFETTHLPIYTTNRLQINDSKSGALGGVVVDPYVHACRAGIMVKKVIEGVDIHKIPVEMEPLTTTVFNYNMLKYFNIEESEIPKESTILGKKDDSILVSREAAISFIVIALVLIAFLILSLLIIKIKIREKNRIKENNKELEEKNKSILELINEEQVTHFFNHNRLAECVEEIYDTYEDFVLYGIVVKNLKSIDEAYGLEYGNQGRIIVGKTLKDILGDKDVYFGRYYDTFYILNFCKKSCIKQEELAESILEKINKTICIGEVEIELSAKIAIVSKSESNGDKNLLKLIDATLLEIGKKDSVNIIRYDQSFQEILYERLQMEVGIKKAFENKTFELYLQPQVSLIEERAISAEALIRWKTEDGFIGPDIFIPIAEDMGMIERIGMWVIDEAVRHIHCLKAEGFSCPIAINISAKQLNSRLVNKLESLLNQESIKKEDISIEITESVLLHFLDRKLEILKEISQLGIKIAIDDFGTGYSSMRYLREFPISKLKIDKYFIDKIGEPKNKSLLRAMIIIAKELSLESVAEGVETSEQLEILREMKVDTIQGWYYKKAVPIEEFIEYFKKNS